MRSSFRVADGVELESMIPHAGGITRHLVGKRVHEDKHTRSLRGVCVTGTRWETVAGITCNRRREIENSEDTRELHDSSTVSELFNHFRCHVEARTCRLQLNRGPYVNVGSEVVIKTRDPSTPEEASTAEVDKGPIDRPDVTRDS